MKARRLLVVDDELDFAKFVARVAGTVGYEVEIATTGKDFEAAVLRGEPDVVVMDIVMPDTDGLMLIQWLAKRHCPARIILVTGFNPQYADAAQMLGTAHGISSITRLFKPISVADLTAALQGGQTA